MVLLFVCGLCLWRGGGGDEVMDDGDGMVHANEKMRSAKAGKRGMTDRSQNMAGKLTFGGKGISSTFNLRSFARSAMQHAATTVPITHPPTTSKKTCACDL
jgi:hypothetical protein